MEREFWIDGFNFFHHWESTKGLLRRDSGVDIVRAIDRSLRILSRHLGRKCGYSVVYLDGGLSRHETRTYGLRVRYCGPGRKADDRLVEDLGELAAGHARGITLVSNDRELRANMRAFGAGCLGVGEFLAVVEGKRRQEGEKGKGGKKWRKGSAGAGEVADVMRQKTRSLSASEVEAWLDFFGVEDEETEPDTL